jgi:hypothetical protein
MQFPETEISTICCFKYRTYMNTISILDKLCMWLLQQQNVKRDVIERKIIANALPTTITAEPNDSIVASDNVVRPNVSDNAADVS